MFVDSGPKIPKTLLIYFIAMHVTFGFDFGCCKIISDNLRTVAQTLSVIMSFVMISLLTMAFVINLGVSNWWMAMYLLQYTCSIVILRKAKYSLCDFIMELYTIQGNLNISRNDKYIGTVVGVYTACTFVVKIIFAVVFCSNAVIVCIQGFSIVTKTVIFIPIIILDIMPVVHCVILYYLYVGMKNVRDVLEKSMKDLKETKIAFKAVLDCFAKLRLTYDNMFLLEFVVIAPKWMYTFWYQLYLSSKESHHPWWVHASGYVFAIHFTLQMCSPAVFAEMTSAQTDAMKLTLHERLLVETDEEVSKELLRVLRYVEERSVLRKVWRLLPVDLRLPLSLLSVCTTYLIVLVQFTHLYD